MTDDTETLTAEEIRDVEADRIIYSINSVRHRLSLGLREAKLFVEREARKIGWKPFVERSPPPPTTLEHRCAKMPHRETSAPQIRHLQPQNGWFISGAKVLGMPGITYYEIVACPYCGGKLSGEV